MADTYAGGHGASIVFTTSAMVMPIRSIGAGQMTRGKVDIGHLALERKKYTPSRFSEPPEFDLEFLFNIACPTYTYFFPDIDRAAEQVTIIYPNPGAYYTPATLSGVAFWVAVGYPGMASDTALVGTGTLAWAGGPDSPLLTPADETP